jgi:hypothetical protein
MENLDFTTLAQQIASHLEGWTWDEPKNEHMDDWQVLAGPDGAKLHLRFDKYGGRIAIHGEYPRSGGTIYPWRDKDRPNDITVSAQREPRVIARDIERRFLQAYLAAYRKGLEMLNTANAHEQAKKDLAARLAKLCGEPLRTNGLEFSRYQADCFHLEVRVDNPDRVRMTIDGLDGQQAEAVLMFLLQQAKPHPESEP